MIDPTSEQELRSFYEKALPGFLEYLRSHATAIENAELAVSREGIVSFPATQVLGGVVKTVRVPLSLVTKDVDTAEQAALEKAEYAKQQGDYAREQGQFANGEGEYASQQGDYASQQGDYAKAQGQYARSEGDYAKENGDAALNAKETVSSWFSTFRAYAETWLSDTQSAWDSWFAGISSDWTAWFLARKAEWTTWFSDAVSGWKAWFDTQKQDWSTWYADARDLFTIWGTKELERQSAEDIRQELAAHQPVPSERGYWMFWDVETHSYVESGFSSRGTMDWPEFFWDYETMGIGVVTTRDYSRFFIDEQGRFGMYM